MKKVKTYIAPKITLKATLNKVAENQEPYIITSSFNAATILKTIFDPNTFYYSEEMILICLNRRNEIIGACQISSGGCTSTVVDQRKIFKIALDMGATGIILSHNHPSGNSQPSEADREITKKIYEGGKLLDIKLLDHVILAGEKHYSFADEGLL